MKNKIKKTFLILQDKVPFVGEPLIFSLRFLRFSFYYKPLFLLNKIRSRDKDIFKLYWIRPEVIKYYSNNKKISLDPKKKRGVIAGGDWDLDLKKLSEIPTFVGLKERFEDNKDWENTDYYSYLKKQIINEGVVHGCYSFEKIPSYFSYVDKLFNDIKNKGYLLNSENKQDSKKTDNFYKDVDEVTINIGRNGRPIFNDGAHRLSIAKILDLEKIPVMVVMRHKKWAEFKSEVKIYAEKNAGRLYQMAYHFDLEDIPYSYGEDRFNLIKDNLKINSGKVLDIGANFGYFCHKLECLGFGCDAVEINPQEVYFMKKLRDADNGKFEIYQDSIFDFKKGEKLKYDIVLALYIFHHFLKREKTYESLKKLLNRLDCKEMFLGTHNPKELPFKDAYKNYEPEQFVQFIINNSKLRKYSLIKEFGDGRRLYKLYI